MVRCSKSDAECIAEDAEVQRFRVERCSGGAGTEQMQKLCKDCAQVVQRDTPIGAPPTVLSTKGPREKGLAPWEKPKKILP